jgi:hypothetical protein
VGETGVVCCMEGSKQLVVSTWLLTVSLQVSLPGT